jgi:hypothetical protein
MENLSGQNEVPSPDWTVASGADPETGVAWAHIDPGTAANYIGADYERVDEITALLRGPDGTILGFTAEELRAFIDGVCNNEFDLLALPDPEDN